MRERWANWAFFGIVLVVFGVGAQCLGTSTLHFLVNPSSRVVLKVDGQPVTLEPANRWHRRASVGRGRHQLELTVDGVVTRYEVENAALQEVLVPLRDQCFVWLTRPGPLVAGRYGFPAPFEVPAGAPIGDEELAASSAPTRGSIPSVLLPIDCRLQHATDEQLLRELLGN